MKDGDEVAFYLGTIGPYCAKHVGAHVANLWPGERIEVNAEKPPEVDVGQPHWCVDCADPNHR
jgi:hypothetical protein